MAQPRGVFLFLFFLIKKDNRVGTTFILVMLPKELLITNFSFFRLVLCGACDDGVMSVNQGLSSAVKFFKNALHAHVFNAHVQGTHASCRVITTNHVWD
jgi:hypothetical protein